MRQLAQAESRGALLGRQASRVVLDHRVHFRSVSLRHVRPWLPALDTVIEAPSSPRIATELDLKRALAVLDEYGLVPVSLKGQVASLRRHAASTLQYQVGRART